MLKTVNKFKTEEGGFGGHIDTYSLLTSVWNGTSPDKKKAVFAIVDKRASTLLPHCWSSVKSISLQKRTLRESMCVCNVIPRSQCTLIGVYLICRFKYRY